MFKNTDRRVCLKARQA